MTFRLLTYNIWRGGGGRVDAIASVVNACRPDVVVLQEATRPDVVSALAARTGMSEARSFARQSLGFLSRRPVVHAHWHRPRFSRHAAWTERRRHIELRALLNAIGAHQHGFHVLAGDFNTLAPGEDLDVRRLPARLRPFVWLSGGRIKWRTIQTVADAGYVDAFRTCHPADAGFTMPSWDPHVRLDYVFVPSAFRDRIAAIDVVRGDAALSASDHLPVVADLTIP